MNCTTALILSKRSWFVPDVRVWGTTGLGELDMVQVERVNGVSSLYHQQIILEGAGQVVRYDSLADYRGNQLPSSLQSPKILVRPRAVDISVAVTSESEESFSIARSSANADAVQVDLYVMELGD
jgi:hypothetical protein